MRKKDENLKKFLLEEAWKIIEKDGPKAINIRTLAQNTHVATGTVYNYFENKDEILLALTQEYWKDALIKMPNIIKSSVFTEQLEEIYSFLFSKMNDSAISLMSSLSRVEKDGQMRMSQMQEILKNNILQLLNSDPLVSKSIWTEKLKPEDFAAFILMNIVQFLQMKKENIDFFIEIIKRIIYMEE